MANGKLSQDIIGGTMAKVQATFVNSLDLELEALNILQTTLVLSLTKLPNTTNAEVVKRQFLIVKC
jgi:hypothetical protein